MNLLGSGDFVVAHVNIRSIIPSFSELSDIICSEEFDICAVTETWLSEDFPDSVVGIAGYQLHRKDRKTRGGGVSLYVSSAIQR